MAKKFNTPLAKLYQQMVERGEIAPVAEPGRFSYPSVLKHVPSFTTYGTVDFERTDVLTGMPLAELESGTK